MKRLLLAVMIFGCAYGLTAQTETSRPETPFQPAETLSVTDIPFPIFSIANGTVVLDALITKTGDIQKVEIRRGIVSLTEVAIHAVEDWKFSPATLAGKAITSRMPVAVNFRPMVVAADPVPLPALIPQSEAAIQAEFQPAEVIRSAFPGYPGMTVASAAIVLEVNLSAKGEPEEVKVLRDLPPLTEGAKAAVGDWRFMPATFNGNPVRSKIVLAFVYPAFIPSTP